MQCHHYRVNSLFPTLNFPRRPCIKSGVVHCRRSKRKGGDGIWDREIGTRKLAELFSRSREIIKTGDGIFPEVS
jgi:hypothetical protein